MPVPSSGWPAACQHGHLDLVSLHPTNILDWAADTLMTLQQRTNKSHKIMHHTSEKMVRLFYVRPSPARCCVQMHAMLLSTAPAPLRQHVKELT